MDLREFLIWLASSAGAGVALSFIAERIPAFDNLPSATKSYVHLGGSLLLALGSYAVITYVPAATLDALLPWFQIVAAVVGTWAANQLAHKADPARVEPVVVVKADTTAEVEPKTITEQDLPMRSRGERA
jgi:hypothetical protein